MSAAGRKGVSAARSWGDDRVNRLANATSPYLLQHKDNPVDWWPWCAQAFDEARRRDVPVLLSVGYSACHWCHVMTHESFEGAATAADMNAHFVNIKVDREERPDVDAVYMAAVQAMTGQGGWPMTALLTPDGEPFYTGTYFPPSPRHGMPAFRQVLGAVVTAWRERRSELQAAGAEVVRHLADLGPAPAGEITPEVLDEAAESLADQYDPQLGGFGGAPKFPPSMCLEFLLRHAARTGSLRSLDIASLTCERMARGGLYDQLGGGFARYSVDAAWVVPHFEKMLNDNALLLRLYLHLWRATHSPLAERIARQSADFLLRDLSTADGGFASSLDADTQGVEGMTYLWTTRELIEVLGADDGPRAAALLEVTDPGTFEHAASVLQLRTDPDDAGWWEGVRTRLLAARNLRPQPACDDKVVTGWNGLAIAALSEAGVRLADSTYVRAAQRCAQFLTDSHIVGGRLRRASRQGRVGDAMGVADDYGNLAEGLLTLHQATGDPHWLNAC